jgi:GAF domain-containing protein/ketosteroid isomerase-like protein
VPPDLAALSARYHRAFNDRDFEVWRELFAADVELVVDGVPFRGVEAGVAYGAGSVSQFPGLYIAAERIVAVSEDTIVTEIELVTGAVASGHSREQGTACEIFRVRGGRIVSVRSYYLPGAGDRADAVRVPVRAEAVLVAEEQAALRRVATLVARGVSQEQLFAAVAEETGWLLSADTTSLLRFEPEDAVTLVAAWNARHLDLPIGSSRPIDDELRSMRETRRPWRRALAELPATGTFVEEARALGMRAFLGVPIVVEGRTWGAVFASWAADRPLAEDAEARLTGFTELVATAIADAHARGELHSFAEEQAALRRVATLVATGAAPAEVFTAVAAEAGRLLRVDFTVLVRSDPDDMITVVGTWTGSGDAAPTPVGRRLQLGGRNVSTLVIRTGRPARLDAYADVSGAIGDTGSKEWGFRSSVGVPISVEGRLWGLVIVAYTRDEPLPAETEARLAAFTELVATAIANTQARVELRGFAEEQAALRRVATLLATGAPPEKIFAAITAEVGRLLSSEATLMSRYDQDDAATIVGAYSRTGASPAPVGSRIHLGGRDLHTLVLRTGRAARIDDYADASTEAVDIARRAGVHSGIGVPISVEGRLWGIIGVTSARAEPLPTDTEDRLTGFTELVATALANAQARVELRGNAEEQAALRRVATLVATGAPPEEIFAAVTAEVGRVLSVDVTFLNRYHPDGTESVLGAWSSTGAEPVPVGTRVHVGGRNVITLVFHTGRPARIDDNADRTGPIAELARAAGIRASVGAPINVAGRLWGVMIVASVHEEPLPADTEARLAGFTELVGTALANAEGRAALTASRARIVAAADTTRRRIERDLHDGAQQRLVSLALRLRTAQESAPADAGELTQQLGQVADGLTGVLDELREIASGLHPAALAEGGLRLALNALAGRSAVPVRIDVGVDRRLSEPIELAAYYVVAEALANAAKHAAATLIDVEVAADADTLRVRVRDDGHGGADPARGSGLIGLTDRVEALGGSLSLHSPPGSGTTVQIALPLAARAGSAPPG